MHNHFSHFANVNEKKNYTRANDMKLFFTKVITIFLITSVSLTLERSFVTVYLEDMTVKTTPAHYVPQKS
jgi:hypothetical protein